MDALIAPEGSLEILSRVETGQLRDAGEGGLYELWRQCSLAVLNSGASDDDVRKILSRHENFRIAVVQYEGGIALELKNAPDIAFVGTQMIRGIREHLFAVLRDLLYAHDDVLNNPRFDLASSRRHHRRRVPHPAQRARVARPRGAAPRRLLGRARDRARGVRLHEGRRLRAGPRGARHLHGLRRRRHERADERRDRRPRQAAHPRRGATWGSPSPRSSRPSRRTRFATSS